MHIQRVIFFHKPTEPTVISEMKANEPSEITAYEADCDLVMSSFDVSSLFTNVNIDECVELSVDLLFEYCDTFVLQDCNFNGDQFRKLLNCAVKENHFVFNKELCDQIDCVAIGSPFDPSIGVMPLVC